MATAKIDFSLKHLWPDILVSGFRIFLFFENEISIQIVSDARCHTNHFCSFICVFSFFFSILQFVKHTQKWKFLSKNLMQQNCFNNGSSLSAVYRCRSLHAHANDKLSNHPYPLSLYSLSAFAPNERVHNQKL